MPPTNVTSVTLARACPCFHPPRGPQFRFVLQGPTGEAREALELRAPNETAAWAAQEHHRPSWPRERVRLARRTWAAA